MNNIKRSVVLVGMMGCGKSSVGVRLARKLEIPFFDLDVEIESDENMTVTEIFEERGEDCFRNLEKNTIEDLLNSKICVVATGGGAFMNKEVRDIIDSRANSVYIRTDFEILFERVARKNSRPLLEKGDKRSILKDLIEERASTYEAANFIVDSTDGVYGVVVDRIIEALGV